MVPSGRSFLSCGLKGAAVTEEHAEAAESTAPLVLIADDEEPIAEAISWVVEELGYTALIARNGREALELAHARRPALLITDWMMPILDGVSLIRALKKQAAQEGLPMIPTILTTAARRAPPVAAEADAFLPKPYELEELEALLRRFLDAPAP